MSEKEHEYSFEAFIELVALTDFDGHRDRHWTSMHTYCNPCAVPYDFIIKQENGAEENDFILKIMRESGNSIDVNIQHTNNGQDSEDDQQS